MVITEPGGPPPASPECVWRSPGPGKGEPLSRKTSTLPGALPLPGLLHQDKSEKSLSGRWGLFWLRHLGPIFCRVGKGKIRGAAAANEGKQSRNRVKEQGQGTRKNGSQCGTTYFLLRRETPQRERSPRRFMFCKLSIPSDSPNACHRM